MEKLVKILIAGFSGAGKSSLIESLACVSESGFEQIDDLDQLVLMSASKKYAKLSDLIEQEGWQKFRLWERQALEGWLKEEGHGVLALGGGAFSQVVFDLFHKHPKIKFCYLKVPFEVAWKRVTLDKTQIRPLAQAGKDQFLELFREREVLYQQIPWVLNGEESLEVNRDKILQSISLHPFSR